MEKWREITDYPKYLISNMGRVKSLFSNKILKNAIDTKGYYKLDLYNNNGGRTFRIHILVAMAFLGHKPNGYESVINHIDFNSLNNNIDNLEITTQRENANRKHCESSSKYVGVIFDKEKKLWRARIVINKKLVHLGYHDREFMAHFAYERALKKHNKTL